MNAKKKRILLIVTGGIASYKSLDLMRLLLKSNFDVNCIITKSVSEFIAPITFNSLLGKKVFSDLFKLDESSEMSHINLASSNDLIVVIPATANFIGKMANGIADDLASTTILASKSPIVIAPAMNTGMYENPAVKSNLKILKKRRMKILDTKFGQLACGQIGKGKLLEVEIIFREITRYFNKTNLLIGKKAIVTSGPSVENIDPVRFISNFSSGIQGYEIAKALSDAGAKTTLISGPTHIEKPSNVVFKKVKTGHEFLIQSINSLPADIYVSVAAISDWKIKNKFAKKIKKNGSPPKIELIENVDVLSKISNSNKRPNLIIGFAAETDDLVRNAKKKLLEKKCDWILGNLVSESIGFNSTKNKVTIIKKKFAKEWPILEKSTIAKKLVMEISDFFRTKTVQI